MDGPPPHRRQLRNDTAHVTELTEWEDLFDSPAYELGCRDPAVLEKLGELDDAVFDAIAGGNGAVERLRSLWAEAKRLVGESFVEESREAYLRHAVGKWREAADAEGARNPRLAGTLMDVLAILLEG